MTTRTLLSLSLLLASGLACAAAWAPDGISASTTTPAQDAPAPALPRAAQDPVAQDPGMRLRQGDPLLEAAADDVSLRVTPVVKAVQRSAASVVSIYILDRTRAQNAGDLRAADGQGSGVILDESGLVITNWHVIALATSPRGRYAVAVHLPSGEKYEAQVLSSSADDDLALLQLSLPPATKVPPIVLGDSDSLMIGETVVAIGNPQGHANTVTAGVLSAIERTITVRAPDGQLRRYEHLLQTDAAINQGNSGGALLDLTGKLIGINNAMVVGSENIGFAIPVNQMRRVFQDVLLSSENLASVWIGVKVGEVAGQDGVEVLDVDASGPAARAGIRPGDRIVAVAGRQVGSALDYARRVVGADPGRPLPLELRRGGRPVEVAPRPLSGAGREIVQRIGVEVETVSADQDRELVVKATRSLYRSYRRARVRLLPAVVRVTQVYEGGSADRLGIEVGDVLLGCHYEDFWDRRSLPFVSEGDLADKLRAFAGNRMQVYVLRGDEELDGPLAVGR